jgi:acetylornithine/N-succinyldiaminopimelate aminotransferase
MSHEPSPSARETIETGQRAFVSNYSPREVVLDHGRGARVWDTDGVEYVDLGTGISVNNLGHQNPDLLAAFETQGRKLWHASNIYWNEQAVRLSEELVEASFAERVFLCNSGAEANEAAIKLARKWSSLSFPAQKREIVTFEGSFHGRTLATVTATAQPKFQEGFEPLPGGFTYCPFNDFDAVEKLVSSQRTCAVLVEPVQGEGGVHPAAPGFLAHLRALCDRHDALLMFDEVQTGMGRTGRLWAHLADGVEPDVMTLAKALGGGMPIGAMLVGAKAADVLQFGSHGSTFGGNPVACAVARASLRGVSSPETEANVARQHERLVSRLRQINDNLGVFSEIRGRGLMIGVELDARLQGQAGDLTEVCRAQGVLVLQAGPNVLRFLPPLNITDEELDDGLDRFAAGMSEAVNAEKGA